MSQNENLFKINNLSTRFFTEQGQINAVEDVSLTIKSGEILSIVGESGSGKSVTGRSILGLIESPGKVTDGKVGYKASELPKSITEKIPIDNSYVDLRNLSPSTLHMLRGTEFGIILQDPGSSFNPSLTVGRQIAEAVEVNRRIKSGESYGTTDLLKDIFIPKRKFISEKSIEKSIQLLERVDIPDPIDRANEYPHQFSGGMLQRAMIAQALATDPHFLVADEPTTGLDVTIQSGIISLLKELQDENNLTILLITHNLGVVSRLSDRTAVMYGGEIFELGPTKDVIEQPANPYTEGLLNSLPDTRDPSAHIEPIRGNVPSLINEEMPKGCSFADRCPKASEECTGEDPPTRLVNNNGTHYVKCVKAGIEESEKQFDSIGKEEIPTKNLENNDEREHY